MSRLQWLIVFLLGAFTACVLGCVLLLLLVPSVRSAIPSTEIAPIAADSVPATAAVIDSTTVPSPTAEPVPPRTNPSAPHIEFQVRQFSTYESRFGSRILVGDAINTSNITVCCIDTVVSLLDAEGKVIETSSYNGADLCEIEPHQRYPFLTPIGDASLKYSEIKIQFHARAAPASIFPCYKKLQVDGLTAHPPQYSFSSIGFTGKVTNVGDESASTVRVFILAYDENDNFFDYAEGRAKLSEIAPGGDSPFEANFHRLREPAARYEIFAQGYRD